MKKKTSLKKHYRKMVFEVLLLLILVGVSIYLSQLIVGYLTIWFLGRSAFDRPAVVAVFSALSYLLAMVIIVFVPVLIRNALNKKKSPTKKDEVKVLNREEIGLKGFPTWTDIGLAPVGFVVYYILAAGLTMLFQFLPWFNVGEAQDTGFSPYLVGSERLLAFFTLVIVAPIAEEIIFRGWLYQKIKVKLLKNIGYTATVIITTFLVSLLFGIIHGQWNVGINVFAMSLALCSLREVTGTIYSGILLHMLKNGLAFYLLYIAGMGF